MWIHLLALELIAGASSGAEPPKPPEQQVTGGYEYLNRYQSKEERRKERIRLGIEQEDIQRVVKKVAKQIAAKPDPIAFVQQRPDYVQELVSGALQGYVFPDIAEAVMRQIRILQAIEQQDEEDLLLLL